MLSSKRAAGWEAIFFYDAYRLEHGAFDESDRTIAKGCKSSKSGPCNFAEFIDHILPKSTSIRVDGQRKIVSSLNPANIPTTLDLNNPDLSDASKIQSWEGWPDPNPKKGGNRPGYVNTTYFPLWKDSR